MANTIMIYYFVFLTVFLPFAAAKECTPGTFLYTLRTTGEHLCIECQDGTFMQLSNHQQTSCRPCEKIKEPKLEILASPCNKTHDAIIHCVDGYYRDLARNPRETGQCKKCAECEFVGQPCSTYRDTVCCPDENFDVLSNHHGVPVCRERPWFCRRGQYFEVRGFQCLPCPDKTFMPIDFHIQPECWKCREYHKFESYRPLHSVIIQPCNSTHAPVIRCDDGFFMNPKMSYTNKALGCSPCTDCSTTDVQYEGRKCGDMEDTVCCPQPNMTVVDTPDGPVCVASSTGVGSLVNEELTTSPPEQVHLTSVQQRCDCSYSGQQLEDKPHYYENECPYPSIISVVLAAVSGVTVLIFVIIRMWEPVLHMCKKVLKRCLVAYHGILALFETEHSRNVQSDHVKCVRPLRQHEEWEENESPSLGGRHWSTIV